MLKDFNDFPLPSLDIYEPPDFSIKPIELPDTGEKNTVCVHCKGDNDICFWCKSEEQS